MSLLGWRSLSTILFVILDFSLSDPKMASLTLSKTRAHGVGGHLVIESGRFPAMCYVSLFGQKKSCLCGCPELVFVPSRTKKGLSYEPTVSADRERMATAACESDRLSTKRMAMIFYRDYRTICACDPQRMIYVEGSVDDAHVWSLP